MDRKTSKDKPKKQSSKKKCTSKKTEAPEKTEAAHELECWSQTSNTAVMEEVNCKPYFFSQKKTFYHNSQCHITMHNVGNCTLNITNGMINVRNNQFDLINNQQFPFIRNRRTITDKPRTAIDNKDCDSTQSTSENSEDKEKHEKDCDCTQSTSENSEDKEKYRFSLEICLEKLVEQFVQKLGIVISPERVLAIYNRLTNKIWAEIWDDIDKIPLKKLKNFHKVMFKALCKKWKDPELILEIMELNYPIFDDKIVNIFMEEAAKLSKKPSCIRRFFSFIGRLFCCTRRQNKVDAM